MLFSWRIRLLNLTYFCLFEDSYRALLDKDPILQNVNLPLPAPRLKATWAPKTHERSIHAFFNVADNPVQVTVYKANRDLKRAKGCLIYEPSCPAPLGPLARAQIDFWNLSKWLLASTHSTPGLPTIVPENRHKSSWHQRPFAPHLTPTTIFGPFLLNCGALFGSRREKYGPSLVVAFTTNPDVMIDDVMFLYHANAIAVSPNININNI